MRKLSLVFVALVATALALPASAATYYVAQSSKTKHCMVTTHKPNGTSMTQVGGDTSYTSRKEATTAMKAASDCQM